MTERARRRIPEATVARLPVYLRSLLELAGDSTTVSSERLAELAGVNAAKVRKDLSYLGSYGTRGVGYDVEYLLFQMSRELGLTQDWPVVIVGIGNLGPRPRQLRRLRRQRLPRRRPRRRRPGQGRPARRPAARSGRSTSCDEIVRANEIAIGIIATPAIAAQDVADRLVAAGHHLDPQLRPRRAHRARRACRCARSTSPSSCRS